MTTNASPALDTSKSPTLGNLNSYAMFTPPVNGSTKGAVLVSSLIDSGGTLANFTDADSGLSARWRAVCKRAKLPKATSRWPNCAWPHSRPIWLPRAPKSRLAYRAFP